MVLIILHPDFNPLLSVLDAPRVEIIRSLTVPQEGQYLKLECVSIANPS